MDHSAPRPEAPRRRTVPAWVAVALLLTLAFMLYSPSGSERVLAQLNPPLTVHAGRLYYWEQGRLASVGVRSHDRRDEHQTIPSYISGIMAPDFGLAFREVPRFGYAPSFGQPPTYGNIGGEEVQLYPWPALAEQKLHLAGITDGPTPDRDMLYWVRGGKGELVATSLTTGASSVIDRGVHQGAHLSCSAGALFWTRERPDRGTVLDLYCRTPDRRRICCFRGAVGGLSPFPACSGGKFFWVREVFSGPTPAATPDGDSSPPEEVLPQECLLMSADSLGGNPTPLLRLKRSGNQYRQLALQHAEGSTLYGVYGETTLREDTLSDKKAFLVRLDLGASARMTKLGTVPEFPWSGWYDGDSFYYTTYEPLRGWRNWLPGGKGSGYGFVLHRIGLREH